MTDDQLVENASADRRKAIVSSNLLDTHLGDYLDHVCVPLVGVVPYARRQELRAELAEHLEALIESYQEMGSRPEWAVVQALQQFGEPSKLSRQWAREWASEAPCPEPRSPWRAMKLGLGCFSAAGLLAAVLLRTILNGSPFSVPSVTAEAGLIGLVLPAVAGLMTGRYSPARPALGAFYALAALIAPTALASLVAVLIQPEPYESGSPITLGLVLAMAQFLYWIPVGCGAAALGGTLRLRLAQKARPWALH